MKLAISLIAASMLLAPASFADTVQTGLDFTQVQGILHGYCSGSTCTSSVTNHFTVPHGEQHDLSPGSWGKCGNMIGFWSVECVPHSLVSAGEGRSPSAGTSTTTTTQTIGFSDGSFSVTTHVETH